MKLDFSEAMANSDRLRALARVRLEEKVAQDPKDSEATWQLAEIMRQDGNLGSARDFYRKLLELNPGHTEGVRMQAILTGQEIPEPNRTDEFQTVPFVRLENFLDGAEVEDIWRLVGESTENLAPSRIGGGKVMPEYRSSNVLYSGKDLHLPWFIERIETELGRVWPRLGIDSFSVKHSELQMTRHVDGEFYKVHRDLGDSGEPQGRLVTFVYYLHTLPRKFNGGDLLLFDTDSDEGRFRASYTRLEPKHNTVVFFPSCYYHQVTPVTTQSTDPMDGRYTLNGWLHATAFSDPGKDTEA